MEKWNAGNLKAVPGKAPKTFARAFRKEKRRRHKAEYQTTTIRVRALFSQPIVLSLVLLYRLFFMKATHFPDLNLIYYYHYQFFEAAMHENANNSQPGLKLSSGARHLLCPPALSPGFSVNEHARLLLPPPAP